MNDKTQKYLDKVTEMLTVPELRENSFLKSVKEFIRQNGFLTPKQKSAVDKMDGE